MYKYADTCDIMIEFHPAKSLVTKRILRQCHYKNIKNIRPVAAIIHRTMRFIIPST